MCTALVWNAPFRLTEITTRFEPYVEGLRAVGVDSITICPTGMEAGYSYPVVTFKNDNQLAEPEFWMRLGCEAGIMITWHRMTNILQAARTAGVRMLAIGDSDGQVSVRAHPWPTLRYKLSEQRSWRHKLGAAKLWAAEWLFRGADHDRGLIAATEASHAFALPTAGGADQFRRFLLRRGATAAAAKLAVVPYPVSATFCHSPVPHTRADRVIAIGRWDAYQKNAPLLAATLERLARRSRSTEFLIVGRGAEGALSAVSKRYPAVRPLGVQPRERVAELMSGCRFVLVPSRWESGPIVANEMLALGGTVVGTPIPTLAGLVADPRFGRVSRSHHPRALAEAVVGELEAWDRGERTPAVIADHWRSRVSPEAVGRRLRALLNADAPDQFPEWS